MKSTTLIVILILFLYGCDAPRNNPLDPESDTYSRQTEVLQLRSIANPLAPLAGITVIAPELGLSAVSDNAGEVLFSHGQAGKYTVTTHHDDYFPLTATITAGILNPPLLLNARPQISDSEIHSVYNNTNASTEYFTSATVTDPDGVNDIRLVVLSIKNSAYRDTFKISDAVKGIFISNQNITHIDPGITAGQLAEFPFHITVYNQNGDSIITETMHVTRVIDKDVHFTEPEPQSRLSGDIVFRWNNVIADYPYTYELEIYVIEDNNFLPIQTYTAIPADSVTFTLTDSLVLQKLSPVNNFARISMRDNSGNRCFSIPLFFTYE